MTLENSKDEVSIIALNANKSMCHNFFHETVIFNQALGHHHNCISVPPPCPLRNVPLQNICIMVGFTSVECSYIVMHAWDASADH